MESEDLQSSRKDGGGGVDLSGGEKRVDLK